MGFLKHWGKMRGMTWDIIDRREMCWPQQQQQQQRGRERKRRQKRRVAQAYTDDSATDFNTVINRVLP